DWRAAVVWVAFAAGWLVWFQDLKRTMFLFYMAPLVPFLILGVTLALGALVGPALDRPPAVVPTPVWRHPPGWDGVRSRLSAAPWQAYYWLRLPVDRGDPVQRRAELRRRWGIVAVSAYLGLVIADFLWMWPIFTGGLLTYDQWHLHMWLPSWV